MKLYTAEQIHKWDQYTIKNARISSVDLMEKAVLRCEEFILNFIQKNRINTVKIFCGSGNNGGDGYALARRLALAGQMVVVYHVESKRITSNENQTNYFRLIHESNIQPKLIKSTNDFPKLEKNDLVIDALLGIGGTHPLDELLDGLIKHINNSVAKVLAIDVPSGLPADINEPVDLDNLTIIKANETLTFQIPKTFFLLADAYPYTGSFNIIDIGLLPDFEYDENSSVYYITEELIKQTPFNRPKFSNKGTFGHLLIISGSYGKIGAAVLASQGALRTGCGLVTTHVPSSGNVILQTAIPEAIVSIDDNERVISKIPFDENYTAIAVGPGIGTDTKTAEALLTWLPTVTKPIVIDADALNIIGNAIQNGQDISFPENCIITPHPKEFDRMIGTCKYSINRLHKQIEFATKYNITIILKGAHTSIAMPNGELYFNSSGNPLLATAGSGDVLSGIISSLLAQGYNTSDAAKIGVYLHGKCADVFLSKGKKTMLASDIISMIPELL